MPERDPLAPVVASEEKDDSRVSCFSAFFRGLSTVCSYVAENPLKVMVLALVAQSTVVGAAEPRSLPKEGELGCTMRFPVIASSEKTGGYWRTAVVGPVMFKAPKEIDRPLPEYCLDVFPLMGAIGKEEVPPSLACAVKPDGTEECCSGPAAEMDGDDLGDHRSCMP